MLNLVYCWINLRAEIACQKPVSKTGAGYFPQTLACLAIHSIIHKVEILKIFSFQISWQSGCDVNTKYGIGNAKGDLLKHNNSRRVFDR